MAKAIGILGRALVWAGIALIAIGYGSILYLEGFSKLADVMSPFNIWNWIAVVVTLAPGILLMQLSERLKKAKSLKTETDVSRGND